MALREAALAYSPAFVDDRHTTIHELPMDERPRERLLQHGAHVLRTEELLAILLRTGTSKENVLELAASLLAKYHGLPGMMRADCAELCTEYGLGTAKATQIKAALELGRRISKQDVEDALPAIMNPEQAAQLVMQDMAYLAYEEMRVLVLDTKHRVFENLVLYKGTVNSSVIRAAEVFRSAVVHNCPAIVLCHNHPSGDPTPSPEDIMVTNQLAQAGRALDITLLDHLVIGRGVFVSLQEQLHWSNE
jgi:DNA repair protein RadC